VWNGVFDPFGEEIAITGLAAMPLRFPGQYADEETGYSYNYYRDYEPTLGRYTQSDPIGLRAGVNTYAYTGNGPVVRIDPLGLYTRCTPGSVDDLVSPECQGPQTGGGVGGGGGGSGGGGGGIIAAIIAWILSSSDDAATEAQQKAERDAYHRRCDEPPPSGLSQCDLIRWKIQRAKDCIRMRQDYMDKWNDTYQGHYDQIAQRQRELENLEEALKKEKCCE
jgi:RHS repeat-associated protein